MHTTSLHTGELDLSLAQRPHTPVIAGPARPRTPAVAAAAPRPTPRGDGNTTSTSPSRLGQTSGSVTAAAGGGEGDVESAHGGPPRSAVSLAWEAFKAHRGGGSLQATVKAAATATSVAVEHLRKRSRNRLLMEKGGSSGKRLSGPLQITLEDLQVHVDGRQVFVAFVFICLG